VPALPGPARDGRSRGQQRARLRAAADRRRSRVLLVGRRWGLDDVQPPSLFRLYLATVSEHSVLIPGRDPELGPCVDRREPVTPA
jgi:hypothetical protein